MDELILTGEIGLFTASLVVIAHAAPITFPVFIAQAGLVLTLGTALGLDAPAPSDTTSTTEVLK